MAKVQFQCQYCGKTWNSAYNPVSGTQRCSTCGDTNLRVKDISKTGVDYYRGDKPFPEEAKKEKKNDIDLDFYFGTGFRGE